MRARKFILTNAPSWPASTGDITGVESEPFCAGKRQAQRGLAILATAGSQGQTNGRV
jgi:hypothetical protein